MLFRSNNNRSALKTLPELQKAIFGSQYKKALNLADENFLGTPPCIRSYQPLGDLLIDYNWKSKPENYRRELNLETGIASTYFTVDGKQFVQEVFVSAPDNIIIVNIKSPDGGLINADFSLTREKDAVVKILDNNTMLLTGQIKDEDDIKTGPGGDHMKFTGELRLQTKSGTINSVKNNLSVKEVSNVRHSRDRVNAFISPLRFVY